MIGLDDGDGVEVCKHARASLFHEGEENSRKMSTGGVGGRTPSSNSGAICAPTQRVLTFLALTFYFFFFGAKPLELQGQFEGRSAFVD